MPLRLISRIPSISQSWLRTILVVFFAMHLSGCKTPTTDAMQVPPYDNVTDWDSAFDSLKQERASLQRVLQTIYPDGSILEAKSFNEVEFAEEFSFLKTMAPAAYQKILSLIGSHPNVFRVCPATDQFFFCAFDAQLKLVDFARE